jgi:hypothetical protein
MKKRKPPIILATLLVVLVGAGFALNTPNLKTKPPGEDGAPPPEQQQPQTPQAPPKPGVSRPAMTKDEMAKNLRGMMHQGGSPGGPPGAPGAPGGDQPSIKVTKPVPYVQPNDPNRTSTHWYK